MHLYSEVENQADADRTRGPCTALVVVLS